MMLFQKQCRKVVAAQQLFGFFFPVTPVFTKEAKVLCPQFLFWHPAKIQNRGHYYIPFLCPSTQETLTGAGFSSHIQRPKLLV